MDLLNSPSLNNFPDLKTKFEEIDKKFLETSRKRMDKESKDNGKILSLVNKGYFELRKDLLILAGTIFGSSIALAAGRSVNNYFIFGELFLFVSIISGLVILLTYLSSEEWSYSFSSKNSLEGYLLLNREKIEKFELDATENLIQDYKKLMDSSQKGFLYFILKMISVEKWPLIFNISFIFGIFLILISIVPVNINQNTITTNNNKEIIITPIPTDYYYVPINSKN